MIKHLLKQTITPVSAADFGHFAAQFSSHAESEHH